jgi:hypothetical protein
MSATVDQRCEKKPANVAGGLQRPPSKRPHGRIIFVVFVPACQKIPAELNRAEIRVTSPGWAITGSGAAAAAISRGN